MNDEPKGRDDLKTLDWLKDATFPRGKEKPSEALWDAFQHPSWDNFLKLIDVTALAQVESGLKRIFGIAIDQTRQDIERSENDPLVRQTALDDLSAMKSEMNKRTNFAFRGIYSLGDLPNLEKPVPASQLKLAIEKKKPGEEERDATMTGPEPEMIFDTRYQFFKTPRFQIEFGNVEKAAKAGKLSEVSVKKAEITWLIFEATTIEKPQHSKKAPEPDPEEEQPHTGEKVAAESKIFQRSALELKLGANDLSATEKAKKPYLDFEARYDLKLGANALFRFGVDKEFGGKHDLKLDFNFGANFP